MSVQGCAVYPRQFLLSSVALLCQAKRYCITAAEVDTNGVHRSWKYILDGTNGQWAAIRLPEPHQLNRLSSCSGLVEKRGRGQVRVEDGDSKPVNRIRRSGARYRVSWRRYYSPGEQYTYSRRSATSQRIEPVKAQRDPRYVKTRQAYGQHCKEVTITTIVCTSISAAFRPPWPLLAMLPGCRSYEHRRNLLSLCIPAQEFCLKYNFLEKHCHVNALLRAAISRLTRSLRSLPHCIITECCFMLTSSLVDAIHEVVRTGLSPGYCSSKSRNFVARCGGSLPRISTPSDVCFSD